jgi:hypothetical protein
MTAQDWWPGLEDDEGQTEAVTPRRRRWAGAGAGALVAVLVLVAAVVVAHRLVAHHPDAGLCRAGCGTVRAAWRSAAVA